MTYGTEDDEQKRKQAQWAFRLADVYLDIVGITLGFRGMLYAKGSLADEASLVAKIADAFATWSLPVDIATVATTKYDFSG